MNQLSGKKYNFKGKVTSTVSCSCGKISANNTVQNHSSCKQVAAIVALLPGTGPSKGTNIASGA